MISKDIIMQVLEIAPQILIQIAVAVGAALLTRGYQLLTERLGVARAERLRQVAVEAVWAAEQVYSAFPPVRKYGSEKLAQATEAVQAFAARYGYEITDSDIRRLIEASVAAWNEERLQLGRE